MTDESEKPPVKRRVELRTASNGLLFESAKNGARTLAVTGKVFKNRADRLLRRFDFNDKPEE